jgi:hypothetical protein
MPRAFRISAEAEASTHKPRRQRTRRQTDEEGTDSWLIRPSGANHQLRQVRIWLGGWLDGKRSVNCGNYGSQEEAEKVRDLLLKELKINRPAKPGWSQSLTPLLIWESLVVVGNRLSQSITRGGNGRGPLPLGVRRVNAGGKTGYVARITLAGVKVASKPRKTAVLAFTEMEALAGKIMRKEKGGGGSSLRGKTKAGGMIRLSVAG